MLDIGYLCIQPRARMRVQEPLWCPFVGPRWVYALAGQYGKHMGRQACRAGDKLAIGPLSGPGEALATFVTASEDTCVAAALESEQG